MLVLLKSNNKQPSCHNQKLASSPDYISTAHIFCVAIQQENVSFAAEAYLPGRSSASKRPRQPGLLNQERPHLGLISFPSKVHFSSKSFYFWLPILHRQIEISMQKCGINSYSGTQCSFFRWCSSSHWWLSCAEANGQLRNGSQWIMAMAVG